MKLEAGSVGGFKLKIAKASSLMGRKKLGYKGPTGTEKNGSSRVILDSAGG